MRSCFCAGIPTVLRRGIYLYFIENEKIFHRIIHSDYIDFTI